VNGQWDVYEYEPEGIGSCTPETVSGSDVYVRSESGCVGLLSSGASAEASAFLDASESGGDVFFLTTAKLAPQDFDNAFDIYDAHECTSSSPCIAPPGQSPPACETAEACRGVQAPQPGIFGPPPSATFKGQGNLTPAAPVVVKKVPKKAVKCGKGLVKKKVKNKETCVKKPKKKKNKAKKSAHISRRAPR
jgi:hypothetical protein